MACSSSHGVYSGFGGDANNASCTTDGEVFEVFEGFGFEEGVV